MKILSQGVVPSPWWVGHVLRCRCGWSAMMEVADATDKNVEISTATCSVRCGTCGKIVTAHHFEAEARSGAASQWMLREDQLRHLTGFTNCPRFDEAPLKEMFQKEGQ